MLTWLTSCLLTLLLAWATMREFLLTQSINVKEKSNENRELDKLGDY